MTTKYLRFNDQEEFEQACIDAGIASMEPSEEGETPVFNLRAYTHDYVLRVLGTITRIATPAVEDEEGNVVEEAQIKTLDGYHVNARGDLPDGLKGFLIPEPNKKAEVFAGDK